CSSPSRCLPPLLRPFPTRRSSDLTATVTPTRSCRHSTRRRVVGRETLGLEARSLLFVVGFLLGGTGIAPGPWGIRGVLTTRRHRSEEHTSELQSRFDLVCRLLLEK